MVEVHVETLEGRINPRRLVGRLWAALIVGGSEAAEREAARALAEHAQQVRNDTVDRWIADGPHTSAPSAATLFTFLIGGTSAEARAEWTVRLAVSDVPIPNDDPACACTVRLKDAGLWGVLRHVACPHHGNDAIAVATARGEGA